MNPRDIIQEDSNNKEEFQTLVNKYVDHYNCNQIESSLYNCYVELDKKIFFKKRKYKKCLEMQKEFQHCLIFSNESKMTKREPYYLYDKHDEIKENYDKSKLENKKDAFDYVSGKKTEEDMLNKEVINKRKNLIEL
jgi:hypothetical protein